MIRSLYSAASGMSAQETNIDNILLLAAVGMKFWRNIQGFRL